MHIENPYSSAHILFTSSDACGRDFSVLCVKESYSFSPDYQLVLRREPELLSFTDACYEDVNTSSLLYPSDIVSFKPATDILLAAESYSPTGTPEERWGAGVSIQGQDWSHSAQVDVTGPRTWEPKWYGSPPTDASPKSAKRFRKWILSQPEPVDRVPLRYEVGFGGQIQRVTSDGDTETIANEYNPVGIGWLDPEHSNHSIAHSAPQLLWPDQMPASPYSQVTPATLGPIPPAWLPRRPLGGTYDEDWIENTWPNWAKDYDFRYNNSAPECLQIGREFTGDEVICLTNLRPDSPLVSLNLTGNMYAARFSGPGGASTTRRMRLDTIYLDLREEQPGQCLLALTWRLPFLRDGLDRADLMRLPNSDRSWRTASPSPHPSQLFGAQEANG